MKLQTRTEKLIATLFMLAFTLWLGGSLIRTIIAYSVFEPSATATLIRQISNDILMQSVYLFAASTLYTLPAYLISLGAVVYFLVKFKGYFKEEGWLMMSIFLFLIAAPIQLYNAYLDVQLSMHIFWGGNWEFYSEQIQNFFLKRFTSIWQTSFGGLSYLANLTILVYLVWQPLKKINNENS
jgi:hypothetical protein